MRDRQEWREEMKNWIKKATKDEIIDFVEDMGGFCLDTYIVINEDD